MRIALTILVTLSFSLLRAQDLVSSIEFVGLKKTKEHYLRTYLDLKEGDVFDSIALSKDIQSLRNHQLFSSINVKTSTSNDGVTITYECKESFTVLPITNFGGVRGNFYTQLGFTNYNWLGRGARMSMYYMYYDRHSASGSFYLPRLSRSNYGISINVNKYSTLEPLFFENATVFYEYDNNALELLGIRELEQNHNILAGGTIFRESYRKDPELDYQNSPGPYSMQSYKYLAKLVHDFKRVDYYYHYLDGFANYAFAESVWTEGIPGTFVKFVNETKLYRRLGMKGNFAFRFKFGLSSNNVGPFAPFVLDSYVNIRGIGNRVDRGTGTLIFNLEHRQTVWQPSWGAIQLVVFSDLGSWRQDGGKLDDFVKKENFQTFVGFGGRIVLNQLYSSVLRMDFGLDLNDVTRNGIVVGLGQYF